MSLQRASSWTIHAKASAHLPIPDAGGVPCRRLRRKGYCLAVAAMLGCSSADDPQSSPHSLGSAQTSPPSTDRGCGGFDGVYELAFQDDALGLDSKMVLSVWEQNGVCQSVLAAARGNGSFYTVNGANGSLVLSASADAVTTSAPGYCGVQWLSLELSKSAADISSVMATVLASRLNDDICASSQEVPLTATAVNVQDEPALEVFRDVPWRPIELSASRPVLGLADELSLQPDLGFRVDPAPEPRAAGRGTASLRLLDWTELLSPTEPLLLMIRGRLSEPGGRNVSSRQIPIERVDAGTPAVVQEMGTLPSVLSGQVALDRTSFPDCEATGCISMLSDDGFGSPENCGATPSTIAVLLSTAGATSVSTRLRFSGSGAFRLVLTRPDGEATSYSFVSDDPFSDSLSANEWNDIPLGVAGAAVVAVELESYRTCGLGVEPFRLTVDRIAAE